MPSLGDRVRIYITMTAMVQNPRLLLLYGVTNYLRVVVRCLHSQNVRDDAVDLNVADQSCKEQLFSDGSAHQPKSRQPEEESR